MISDPIDSITRFPHHDVESAPEKSKPELQNLIDKIGFAPNVARTMAESPTTLVGYLRLNELFLTKASFRAKEKQLIFLIISRENECDYCVAAHSFNASHAGLAKEDIEAIRSYQPLHDLKLNALAKMTSELVLARGWASEEVSQEFLDAGYNDAQLLEVVLAIGLKTVSNYANHITKPELDPVFQEYEWSARDNLG